MDTMQPKCAIWDLENSHLLGLSCNPTADNFSNTLPSLQIWSSGVLEKHYIIIQMDYAPVKVHIP